MARSPVIILGVQTPGDIQEQTLNNAAKAQQVEQNEMTLEKRESSRVSLILKN